MVSQPQTRKHPEPKALWPTLGGLAVLMHIGILGFSLPYLIELMRLNPGSRSSAIPIELILEDSDEGSIAAASQPPAATSASDIGQPPEETASQPEPSQPAASQSNSQAVNPIETGTSTTPTDATASPPESTVSSAPPSTQPREETPTRPEPANREVNSPTDKPEADEPETSEPETDESQTDELAPADQNSQDATGSPSDLPGDSADEGAPPVLPSDQTIPAPGSEAAGGDLPQTAFLKVVGYSEVPASLQRGIVTTPPLPINRELAAIELRPQDVGCAQLDFSRSQVTYRIAVNTDGSMRAASPWTGSIEARPPLTQQESAIACLLLASGFRFTPATFEGEPVVNDYLLLTIDLIESQPD